MSPIYLIFSYALPSNSSPSWQKNWRLCKIHILIAFLPSLLSFITVQTLSEHLHLAFNDFRDPCVTAPTLSSVLFSSHTVVCKSTLFSPKSKGPHAFLSCACPHCFWFSLPHFLVMSSVIINPSRTSALGNTSPPEETQLPFPLDRLCPSTYCHYWFSWLPLPPI